MRTVAIVGGGISGLATAYYLAKAGIPSTLIESQPRLGGVIQTERVQDCVIEKGPDSFISIKPWAMDLIRELGLAGEAIGSNDHLRVTYVRKKGRLVPLPDGLMMMVPTKIMPLALTPLLSWPTKIRMGLEWFRRPPSTTPRDRSVAEFIKSHYGSEAVDYLAEPLLSGVYGGDPEKLSAASVLARFVELEAKYGSLTRGVLAGRRRARQQSSGMPLFQTLKGGLGQLVDTLSSAAGSNMEVVHQVAETLEQQPRGFRVRVAGDWLEAEHVVLACQAYQAGSLTASLDAELAGLLGSVPYNSSIILSLGFEKSTLGHPLNGFGFLVPKLERRRLVACTWVGTKFSHRTREDLAVLRCFIGGGDEGALAEDDESLVAAVREELQEIMGVTATPVFTRLTRWHRSMAQYTVGHSRRIEKIEKHLRELPGLFLAGNAYSGIGVPDCIRMGKAAAEKIAASRKQT